LDSICFLYLHAGVLRRSLSLRVITRGGSQASDRFRQERKSQGSIRHRLHRQVAAVATCFDLAPQRSLERNPPSRGARSGISSRPGNLAGTSPRSRSQSRDSRRIRLTRTLGRRRPVVEKIVATPTPPVHPPTCPTPPPIPPSRPPPPPPPPPVPPGLVEPVADPPTTMRRGMLAVPSRCSIFRAFRYFPINRKARARAFARLLARSLARPPGLAQIGTKRSTRIRARRAARHVQACARSSVHACTPKYTGTRKHTYASVYVYYRARVF